MRADSSRFRFLKSSSVRAVSLLLIAEAILFYSMATGEQVPVNRPLSGFPIVLSGWKTIQEQPIDEATLSVLKANDTLDRSYIDPSGQAAINLFVAFFRSQRAGVAPHSPQVCLPGSGWIPTESDIIPIDIPGETRPIRVNRYVVSRGESKSLVLYWYQSFDRVVASEYAAKFYLIVDGLRYHRSDTSLVRVVVPIINGDEKTAEKTAVRFVKVVFPPLRKYLPS